MRDATLKVAGLVVTAGVVGFFSGMAVMWAFFKWTVGEMVKRGELVRKR